MPPNLRNWNQAAAVNLLGSVKYIDFNPIVCITYSLRGHYYRLLSPHIQLRYVREYFSGDCA
jgi:hypothetical protein